VVLAVSTYAPLLIAGQVVPVCLLLTISIHLSRELHDLVPAQLRTGVSSAVGTMSWLTFLPCSLLFSALSARWGIHAAGAIITVLVGVAGAILLRITGRSEGRRSCRARRPRPAAAAPGSECHPAVS
jgi:hypothetical protein